MEGGGTCYVLTSCSVHGMRGGGSTHPALLGTAPNGGSKASPAEQRGRFYYGISIDTLELHNNGGVQGVAPGLGLAASLLTGVRMSSTCEGARTCARARLGYR